jgi:hypothetical protein
MRYQSSLVPIPYLAASRSRWKDGSRVGDEPGVDRVDHHNGAQTRYALNRIIEVLILEKMFLSSHEVFIILEPQLSVY